MTNITRSAEYRYFSFTYFYGKAYSVWLKMCVIVSDARKRLSVHDDPQPNRLRVFLYQPHHFRRNTV